MAVLTINTVDRTGTVDPIAVLVAAAAGGDSFPNTGVQYVVCKNAGAGSITVTLVLQATADGQAETTISRTVTVANGAQKIFGPFPTSLYNDGNGRMNFTYSGVTSVTIGVFQNTTS